MAGLQADVPERCDEVLDVGPVGCIRAAVQQDQDIQIGPRVELTASVAADGGDAGALWQGMDPQQFVDLVVGDAAQRRQQGVGPKMRAVSLDGLGTAFQQTATQGRKTIERKGVMQAWWRL